MNLRERNIHMLVLSALLRGREVVAGGVSYKMDRDGHILISGNLVRADFMQLPSLNIVKAITKKELKKVIEQHLKDYEDELHNSVLYPF